jgi:hypothetical protein
MALGLWMDQELLVIPKCPPGLAAKPYSIEFNTSLGRRAINSATGLDNCIPEHIAPDFGSPVGVR